MEYNATKAGCADILANIVLAKMPGRKIVYTIDMQNRLQILIQSAYLNMEETV
jgi:hypothetical protein